MSIARLAIAAALMASASAAQATTVIVYVEPMTLERYTRVFDTPGPDRASCARRRRRPEAAPSFRSSTAICGTGSQAATVSSNPSNKRRPSTPPCAGSIARSGCGISPSTLPAVVEDARRCRAPIR